MNDSLSDLFTRIRNAYLVGHNMVRVPLTSTNRSILEILVRHGFIQNFHKQEMPTFPFQQFLVTFKSKFVIRKLQRLSRPGCRLYASAQNIPQIRGQLGIIFISTSKGILSDREARYFKLGGEILGYIS
uniref:Ribosomal protein S8 n=1 Tax=Halimeda hummii TaxID=170418 RepID=Q4GX17_9CHLO|nr:ribosomal protein S8 [Halimeda hummii]